MMYKVLRRTVLGDSTNRIVGGIPFLLLEGVGNWYCMIFFEMNTLRIQY